MRRGCGWYHRLIGAWVEGEGGDGGGAEGPWTCRAPVTGDRR